ncbi:MAG: type II toxin-antitoxin system VapC family toxin [Candidatus Brockarchaeota archaeon]|nr:type II toxin-antitoxin system VapC family toxin [Candidatus Brockarchaeota archaeon]
MLLVDTNIFLELFLGQEKAEECEKFLQKISDGELEAVVSKFTIHAVEAILNNPSLILAFLRNVHGSLGLNVYETSLEDEMASSMLMDKIKLDFDDSLQYYVAKKLGVEAIVSYDKHFDALDVARREPAELL